MHGISQIGSHNALISMNQKLVSTCCSNLSLFLVYYTSNLRVSPPVTSSD